MPPSLAKSRTMVLQSTFLSSSSKMFKASEKRDQEPEKESQSKKMKMKKTLKKAINLLSMAKKSEKVIKPEKVRKSPRWSRTKQCLK